MGSKKQQASRKVEEEFAKAIAPIGGERVDIRIVGPNKPLNADFYFPEYNVLAEVKELDDDPMPASKRNEKIAALYRQEVVKGSLQLTLTARCSWMIRHFPTTFAGA